MTELENELLNALEYVLEWVDDSCKAELNRELLDDLVKRANSQPGFKTATRMTLLELLVKELDKWPDGTHCIAQDHDQWVMGFLSEPHYICGSWAAHFSDFVYHFPLSSDHSTAIITREQWEAAKCKHS